MEPSYDHQVIKCPICGSNVSISVGRYRGGVNDSGGWVLDCAGCNGKFAVSVSNPSDLSSVISGATIIERWDKESDDKGAILDKYELSEKLDSSDRLLIKLVDDPDESLYNLVTHPLYRCDSCREPIDAVAYDGLATRLSLVNSAISSYLNFYLANKEAAPDGISVRMQVSCKCGTEHGARFYMKFSERFAPRANEFWLIDIGDNGTKIDIDGIYSRDDCIAILEKLLLRWQAVHNGVLLAAPFIGFNYPGARMRIPDLWNWVLKYTDPKKTSIITRKATFNLLKDTSKDTEMDVDLLASWGLLNRVPPVRVLDAAVVVGLDG